MKNKTLLFVTLLIIFIVVLSAYYKPSAKKHLLKNWQQANAEIHAEAKLADTQVDLNAVAAQAMRNQEKYFYQAAAFKIKQNPQETDNILRDVFIVGQQVARIENASFEGTGSIESMLRANAKDYLYRKHITAFLADTKTYQRWQRVKNASGQIQGDLVHLQNGVCYLKSEYIHEGDPAFNMLVDYEISLFQEHSFTSKGIDYAIVCKNAEKAVNNDFLALFFAKIKDEKFEIMQQLPMVFVDDFIVAKGQVTIRGRKRLEDYDTKSTTEIEIKLAE